MICQNKFVCDVLRIFVLLAVFNQRKNLKQKFRRLNLDVGYTSRVKFMYLKNNELTNEFRFFSLKIIVN